MSILLSMATFSQVSPDQSGNISVTVILLTPTINIAGAYVLMTGKQREMYDWVFQELWAIAQRLEVQQCGWKRVTTDFESALFWALSDFIRAQNMDTQLSGCHFHFCQCIYKHTQCLNPFKKLGGVIGSALHNFVRQIMALPFLPYAAEDGGVNSRAVIVFEFLLSELRELILSCARFIGPLGQGAAPPVILSAEVSQRMTAALDGITAYMHKQWFDAPLCVSQSVWCCHDILDYRTNNNGEGRNHKAQLDHGVHPPLFDWVIVNEKSIVMDALKYATLMDESITHQQQYKKPVYRVRDEELGRLRAELVVNDLASELAYVKEISHLMQADKKYHVNADDDLIVW